MAGSAPAELASGLRGRASTFGGRRPLALISGDHAVVGAGRPCAIISLAPYIFAAAAGFSLGCCRDLLERFQPETRLRAQLAC